MHRSLLLGTILALAACADSKPVPTTSAKAQAQRQLDPTKIYFLQPDAIVATSHELLDRALLFKAQGDDKALLRLRKQGVRLITKELEVFVLSIQGERAVIRVKGATRETVTLAAGISEQPQREQRSDAE